MKIGTMVFLTENVEKDLKKHVVYISLQEIEEI